MVGTFISYLELVERNHESNTTFAVQRFREYQVHTDTLINVKFFLSDQFDHFALIPYRSGAFRTPIGSGNLTTDGRA